MKILGGSDLYNSSLCNVINFESVTYETISDQLLLIILFAKSRSLLFAWHMIFLTRPFPLFKKWNRFTDPTDHISCDVIDYIGNRFVNDQCYKWILFQVSWLGVTNIFRKIDSNNLSWLIPKNGKISIAKNPKRSKWMLKLTSLRMKSKPRIPWSMNIWPFESHLFCPTCNEISVSIFAI